MSLIQFNLKIMKTMKTHELTYQNGRNLLLTSCHTPKKHTLLPTQSPLLTEEIVRCYHTMSFDSKVLNKLFCDC